MVRRKQIQNNYTGRNLNIPPSKKQILKILMEGVCTKKLPQCLQTLKQDFYHWWKRKESTKIKVGKTFSVKLDTDDALLPADFFQFKTNWRTYIYPLFFVLLKNVFHLLCLNKFHKMMRFFLAWHKKRYSPGPWVSVVTNIPFNKTRQITLK